MRTIVIICCIVLPVACLTAVLLGRAGANGTHQTERVSVATDGTQANADSSWPVVSGDGRYVAFHSTASNLVADDTNLRRDVFVRDRSTGTTERISVSSAGEQGDGDSGYPSISFDGRYVAFESRATNLVSGDTSCRDVYVYDRQTDTIEKISVATDGTAADNDSGSAAISGDGQCVAFVSWATNLGSPVSAGVSNVFVRDRAASQTQLITKDYAGGAVQDNSYVPCTSADGTCVAFVSWAGNLVSGWSNTIPNIFLYDRTAGHMERVSVDSDENPEQCCSDTPSISADGRYVAFSSMSPNLAPGDTDYDSDIFVRDRVMGTTEFVSVDSNGNEALGNNYWGGASITADGRYVAFSSEAASLAPGDGNGVRDVFVRDRVAGNTYRVSLETGGGDPDGASDGAVIAAYAAYPVAFYSSATNLVPGDTNGRNDVFLVFTAPLAVRWPR